ncbi:MAG: hypothetical protein DSM106950_12355 [Stigonema ocellatum SAG 48.90 = DSM 106950]|nr:hypothetical protein [Stigonema ocellatum SAG 48.90 = DSM 106950]
MAAKKTKKQPPSQPRQPDEPKQTLLSIKPSPVESPKSSPPTQPQVLVPEPVPLDEQVKEKLITVKPKPVKRLSTPPTPTEVDLQPPTPTLPAHSSESSSEVVSNSAIFQAVGIIAGVVNFNDEGHAVVSISGHEYPLFYIPKKRRVFDALQKEVTKNTGNVIRLIVYPKVTHFPRREQLHTLSFQLVGFENPEITVGITKQLQDLEFRLCGLWQFIPVCQTPCISVLRNFTEERLQHIKQVEPYKRVKFMKASHVPLIWKDAPVRPFRFNPKLEKQEQGFPHFVEVLAKFIPGRDVFGFVSLLSMPMEKAPKFLKARKEDKAEALKTKMALMKDKNIAKRTAWSKPKKKES